jgi:hypothetical protein
MSKQVDTFELNTYELPRRAGEMKEYELDIVMSEKFGVADFNSTNCLSFVLGVSVSSSLITI